MIDVTNVDDTVLAQLLRFLFNQAHRLTDLQLKKQTRPPCACAISRRCACPSSGKG